MEEKLQLWSHALLRRCCFEPVNQRRYEQDFLLQIPCIWRQQGYIFIYINIGQGQMPQREIGASQFVSIDAEPLICFPESRWPHPGCPPGASPALYPPQCMYQTSSGCASVSRRQPVLPKIFCWNDINNTIVKMNGQSGQVFKNKSCSEIYGRHPQDVFWLLFIFIVCRGAYYHLHTTLACQTVICLLPKLKWTMGIWPFSQLIVQCRPCVTETVDPLITQ